MISQIEVDDEWAAITTAGQSGTAWQGEQDSLDTDSGSVDVVIYHSAVAAPTGDLKLGASKRLFKPAGNHDVMILSADSGLDIFYARCVTSGSTATINVDVV